MRKFAVALGVLMLAGCASMAPKATSSNEMNAQGSLTFAAPSDATTAAIKAVLKDKKWKLQYEGQTPPDKRYGAYSNRHPFSGKDYNKVAWDTAVAAGSSPRAYVQARTPISAFSFGAELFIVVFESKESGSFVSIAASTSQIVEKDKLPTYISEFSESLNDRID